MKTRVPPKWKNFLKERPDDQTKDELAAKIPQPQFKKFCNRGSPPEAYVIWRSLAWKSLETPDMKYT